MARKKEKSFEENLLELESVVKALETGELSLEESLGEFQRGIEIYKVCNSMLNDVDGKLKLMTSDSDLEISLEDIEG